MEWLNRMNLAIDYIEKNLTDQIDMAQVARIACTSTYQFQRMFSYILNVSLAEYIRRRRLTFAAIELKQNREIKVIDVALKYQYDSPVSFARAFYAVHGVSPTSARNKNVQLRAYPRLSFVITIKGVEAMEYRIETLDSFEIFGIEGIFEVVTDDTQLNNPAKLWERSHANGDIKQLEACAGKPPSFVSEHLYPVNAICSYRKIEDTRFPYMLFVFKDEGSHTEGYTNFTVPSMTWVILNSTPHDWSQFSNVIEQLYHRFYSEWLPASGYEPVDGMELEMYGEKDGLNYLELWFAVRKIQP